MPTATPAEASNDSRMGGRPPWSPCAAAGSERSTTSPSACSSETRLETVERESPVRRAISAREISPSSRRASMTRRRLRRRSVSSDPVRPAIRGIRTDRETFVKSVNEPGRSLRRVRSGCDGSWSADRVRVDRDDDVTGGLVVPALLLLVPQHPEVAQEERDGGDDADEVAHERAAVADRAAAAAEVVDADAERLLADGLAGRTALEVHVVGDADERRDQVRGGAVADGDDDDDARHGQDQAVEDERAEALPEPRARAGGPRAGVHGLLLVAGLPSSGRRARRRTGGLAWQV